MTGDYIQDFNAAVAALPDELQLEDIARPAVRVPTQANSDFASNAARGRWAEQAVGDAIDAQLRGTFAVSHGENNELVAGEPGFREHFLSYHEELLRIGKRCDLLLFESGAPIPAPSSLRDEDVRRAFAGLEVRSSAQNVSRYRLSRLQQPAQPRKRDWLAFTVKAEDIRHIQRWVNEYGVPHYYVQVFDDRVYAISTLELLRRIVTGQRHEDYVIEKHRRSQFKTTVHVNIAAGRHIADIVDRPDGVAVRKQLPAGRVLYYVELHGGRLHLHQHEVASTFGRSSLSLAA